MGETSDALRRKLLDLTIRNPLLSFKHSTRGQRYVRVIDELPNQLFERLEGERFLRFKSIGIEQDERRIVGGESPDVRLVAMKGRSTRHRRHGLAACGCRQRIASITSRAL
ncbi:MAG: DUF4011 domain-containing protein [Phycisphaeraceae bacterium]|nr:DUF4011 domain-containing protein [Phycisphaeraceae bacterium]